MPGILYVVATPIGNLEDVTLRALRILREVSLIAAEDTRRTSKLLQHYSISTPTTSLHEHNEHAKAPRLVQKLIDGESIALVSDAGTPAISDPGSRLVAAAHHSGIQVVPVPGASAVTAAVSAAGLLSDGFTFLGFPPTRSNSRKRWLRELTAHPFPLVLYEAPHRIEQTLADIETEMGERTVAIGRELTKIHEYFAIQPISDWLKEPPPAQGEFVLIIFPGQTVRSGEGQAPRDADLAAEFWRLTNNAGLERREAIREVARRHGISTRTVFKAIEDAKKSAERPNND
ncbi:MAG TPA: 16S rRNA (cytidine(1402)-2'-O)-methyltransferase [Vicinamibacterales bacterium]